MKILLSHRYFWPDTTPYAHMLRTIGVAMVESNHEVHVFSSKPSYRKQSDEDVSVEPSYRGVNIRRCWVFQERDVPVLLRFVNVLLYSVGLFVRVLVLKPDVVTASTYPPVMAASLASLAAKIVGARFIYHMQDIHPEVSELSGGLMGKKPLANVFRWIDNQTLKRSAAIIVLSGDMAATLNSRELGSLPIHIINNFSLDNDSPLDPPPPEYANTDNKRRAIFAGNLGRFQNLPAMTDGVARCFKDHPDLELFYLGDGKVLPDLKNEWESHPQVRFAPFLPLHKAKALISEAEVGLVSISEGIYKVAYPSKILTYLGLGLPLLLLTEPESELARELTKAGVAVVPESLKPEDVARSMDTILDNNYSREDILRWYSDNYSFEKCAEKWHLLLEDINPAKIVNRI